MTFNKITVKRCLWLLIMLTSSISLSLLPAHAQTETEPQPPSIARQWNEALLYAIRIDFARPVVHARNLFHTSAAMYDIWATYDNTASPYFLGRTQNNGFSCPMSDEQRTRYQLSEQLEADRDIAISTVMYRLLRARFEGSPGEFYTYAYIDHVLDELGISIDTDTAEVSSDINSGSPSALGHYLANCIIEYGLNDGSNESDNYQNQFYEAVNEPLNPTQSGNVLLNDPDRWQPLKLDIFIDQSGNRTESPGFLGAEWGYVEPFALSATDKSTNKRDGHNYPVYLDPGPPAKINDNTVDPEAYLWGHTMVALWSSHLDPTDGVMWDISPASLGNSAELPNDFAELPAFYKAIEGGTEDQGYSYNPSTGEAYQANVVPRGDYTRVLAEFWADGPSSETPPGHWFSIYNEKVAAHPQFERHFMGASLALSPLDYDIRAYFTLGAAMHDAAISAWSIKAWHDSIRPISALRYIGSLGQRSDASASNYHPKGIELIDGLIETVKEGDPLAGNGGFNIGRIKVRTWRGPSFINNPQRDIAGVNWILLDNWWPYQRATFVTPPFAGYVSGHSTFSRAAAEVLTSITGDAFFPGGLAEFVAEKDTFLEFEDGPTVDITLQWATYRDASDQTSLSRIWGGIHPPFDDIVGRQLGITVADQVLQKALTYFDGSPADPVPTQTTNSGSSSNGCSVVAVKTDPSNNSSSYLIALLCLFLASIKLTQWLQWYRTEKSNKEKQIAKQRADLNRCSSHYNHTR